LLLHLCIGYWKGFLQVFCDSKCNCYCLWFSCSVYPFRESAMEISSGLGFGNMQHTDLICFINLIASVQYRTPEQILQSDFRHCRMQETFHNLTHNCSSFFLFFVSSRCLPCCSFQAFRRPWRLLR
jgi:hypothetical protein